MYGLASPSSGETRLDPANLIVWIAQHNWVKGPWLDNLRGEPVDARCTVKLRRRIQGPVLARAPIAQAGLAAYHPRHRAL
jgi:hypothetical protein